MSSVINLITEGELKPEIISGLNDFLCSIFVPFEETQIVVDTEDPNSIFQLARLVCSCADISQLHCRSRWKCNQDHDLGDYAMIAAMCGLGYLPEVSGKDESSDEPICLFCSSTVGFTAKLQSKQGNDLMSLVDGHQDDCCYRWFLTHERQTHNPVLKLLSPENKNLLSHLQKEMSKMDVGRDFGLSGDVICTAITYRYLRDEIRDQSHIEIEFIEDNDDGFVDIDRLMSLLSECVVPPIPGIAACVNAFQKTEIKEEYRVWPRIKSRFRRPNYYLRQVVLLPQLREEVEIETKISGSFHVVINVVNGFELHAKEFKSLARDGPRTSDEFLMRVRVYVDLGLLGLRISHISRKQKVFH